MTAWSRDELVLPTALATALVSGQAAGEHVGMALYSPSEGLVVSKGHTIHVVVTLSTDHF